MILESLIAMAPDWAVRHCAVLIPVVPLMLAPVLALGFGGRIAWLFTVAGTAATLYLSLITLALIQSVPGGVVSYPIGNWPPPIGIEFRIDALNAMILLVVSSMGLLASVFSWPTIKASLRKEKIGLFYAAYLLCFAGLTGVAVTGDAFNLFVFLEISSLASYVLVAMGAGQDRRALPAALDYLVMGTIGASFYVIGVGFLYAVTGTLNLADLAAQLPALTGNRAVQVGFAFILVGLGLKAAMWPLHQWLPNAYAYSPGFVTVFLASAASKVALYALVRWTFTVFNPGESFETVILSYVLAPLGLAAMLICSFQAVFQNDVRRMLAYSSVSQAGVLILAVSTATAAGVSAGLLHLFNHALMSGALFMAIAGIGLTHGGTTIRDFAGLGRTAPFTMTAFAIGGLSLIGVPLTAGFISKLQLGYALFAHGWWWAVIVLVVSSLLAVLYVGRLLQAVFFEPPVQPGKPRQEAPMILMVPLWILALASIFYGIDASFPIGLAQDGAAAALGLEGVP